MPLCPHCQSPYEEGQRYCDKCDSYLLNPEEGHRFCPQCGIRVAAQQEVCHKCNAALPAGSGSAPTTPEQVPPKESEPPPGRPQPPSPAASFSGLPMWAQGALIGAGVLILILVAFILIRQPAGAPPGAVSPPTAATPEKAPTPAALPRTEPAPAPSPAAPESTVTAERARPEPTFQAQPPAVATTTSAPAATLEDQIKETLNNLREAQLRQDLILFMSCYSYIYPALDKKRRDTQAYWHEFNFLGLDYTLDEVKPVGQDTALAKVTWTMQVQSRRSQLIDTFMQTYEVGLAKELGKWRIRSLREIEED